MTLGEFVVLFIVAAIIGGIGESLAGYSIGGFITSAFVGWVGAILGHWVQGMLHMGALLPVHVGGRTIDIVWAVVGAAVFVFILRLIRRPRTMTYN